MKAAIDKDDVRELAVGLLSGLGWIAAFFYLVHCILKCICGC